MGREILKGRKRISNQHGDVLLTYVDELPSTAKQRNILPGHVVERGEGVHTHVLPDVSNVEYFVDETTGIEYYRVGEKGTKIDHEEHGVQHLSEGICFRSIEVEYDLEKQDTRFVKD